MSLFLTNLLTLKGINIYICTEGGHFSLVNDIPPIYGASLEPTRAVEKTSAVPSASSIGQPFWELLKRLKGPFLMVLCQSAEFESNSAVPERVVVFDASNGARKALAKSHDVTLNLSDLGLHKMQSRRWQLAAAIPDERFEQHVAEVRDAGKELTSAGVLRLARQLRKEQERLEYRENGHEPGLYSVDDCIAIIGDAREMDLSQFPTKYGVIIADPPWPYRVSRKRGVAEEYYNTMTDEEIAAVPVAELAADDCVLFLWTTWPKVPVALDVIKAWGFDYVSGFPWVKATTTSNPKSDIREIKLSFGVGFWFRGMTEVIFLARKGKPKLPDMAYAGILAPNMEHSKKPESVHQIAREMTGPYLELFARETRPGWTVFGNNIQGKLV